jgi:hypothetical protein
VFFYNDGIAGYFSQNYDVNGNIPNAEAGCPQVVFWDGNGAGAGDNNFGWNLTTSTGPPTRIMNISTTNFWPTPSNVNLGIDITGESWNDIYAQNNVTVVSDQNAKTAIEDEPLGLPFINSLKPRRFKMKNGTNGRYHHGLVAQEVETALQNSNISTSDFAGFVKSTRSRPKLGPKDIPPPPTTSYALRYGEFISILIKAVQDLSTSDKINY